MGFQEGNPLNKTALIVDDSKTARVVLKRMLEAHELDVDTAEIEPSDDQSANDTPASPYRCHDCGGEMVIVESFEPTSRDPPILNVA